MLVLSRKINESIVIAGDIVVKVIRVEGDTVKLGIEAPENVPVHRQEVYAEICKHNRAAATDPNGSVPKLKFPPRASQTAPTFGVPSPSSSHT